ncbi:hypothetical protein EVAR_40610_1 [Eumeta japonica]|uniref:Uncharacterized protein n=1 Tax=Eumeta variegata TaxID=151549 RepID=A0A4C1XIN5_EUMVA|nr:hypothetical protein EVAR_40610_1 [Eumeta japonica]
MNARNPGRVIIALPALGRSRISERGRSATMEKKCGDGRRSGMTEGEWGYAGRSGSPELSLTGRNINRSCYFMSVFHGGVLSHRTSWSISCRQVDNRTTARLAL